MTSIGPLALPRTPNGIAIAAVFDGFVQVNNDAGLAVSWTTVDGLEVKKEAVLKVLTAAESASFALAAQIVSFEDDSTFAVEVDPVRDVGPVVVDSTYVGEDEYVK